MVKRSITLTVIVGLFACFLGGCGEKSEPEPRASQEAAKAAGSDWSKEQVDAFKKAHDEARAGKDK